MTSLFKICGYLFASFILFFCVPTSSYSQSVNIRLDSIHFPSGIDMLAPGDMKNAPDRLIPSPQKYSISQTDPWIDVISPVFEKDTLYAWFSAAEDPGSKLIWAQGDLGGLSSKKVTFIQAENRWVGKDTFLMLTPSTIGKQSVNWTWETNDPLREIGTSSIILYSIMNKPLFPQQIPWIPFLDYACIWASGQQIPIRAAHIINKNLHNLRFPSGPIQYNVAEHFTHNYRGVSTTLNLYKFEQERQRSLLGNSPVKVNCMDATLLTISLMRCVGIPNVSPIKITPDSSPTFHTNPISTMGMSRSLASDEFAFHVIAMHVPRLNLNPDRERVYDPSFKVYSRGVPMTYWEMNVFKYQDLLINRDSTPEEPIASITGFGGIYKTIDRRSNSESPTNFRDWCIENNPDFSPKKYLQSLSPSDRKIMEQLFAFPFQEESPLTSLHGHKTTWFDPDRNVTIGLSVFVNSRLESENIEEQLLPTFIVPFFPNVESGWNDEGVWTNEDDSEILFSNHNLLAQLQFPAPITDQDQSIIIVLNNFMEAYEVSFAACTPEDRASFASIPDTMRFDQLNELKLGSALLKENQVYFSSDCGNFYEFAKGEFYFFPACKDSVSITVDDRFRCGEQEKTIYILSPPYPISK